MPLIPDLRERLVTLRRNAGPNFMTDFLSAWGFRSVVLAFRLGIFEALESGAKTPREVADATGIVPQGAEHMLDALDCLGYVRSRDGRYSNTPMTSELMTTMPDGIRYFEKIVFRDWTHLENQLRDGSGVRPVFFAGDWRIFNDGMIALANMNIDEVVRRVKIPRSARHLLDLGGGHALYSVEFCRKHPHLKATVFDIPQMEKLARQKIDEHDMNDRVEYRSGDFFVDDLGSTDVVLLFNVIHSKSEAENQEILKRVADCLRPGGTVVVLDQFPTRELGNIGYAYGALMALSMLSAAGQRTYRIDEVKDWCRQVGLGKVKHHPIRSAPGNALVTATKLD